MSKKQYFCIEMSGKGSISRMSDECLMKQETVFSFYVVYQAVMRKFTLAEKSCAGASNEHYSFHKMNFYCKTLYSNDPNEMVIAAPRTHNCVVLPTLEF